VEMEVRPFKAFRFDEQAVGDVGNCIAPPYDVISPAQQQRLYEKSEYNIVRIIKGKTSESDGETNNQYTRAAEYLNGWIEKGVLKQDSTDAIYAYVQDFQIGGADFRRLSFVALGRLEEFGEIVKPHEQILIAPTIDRLNLKRATGAKFGLVFMLYEDKNNVADKTILKAAEQKPLIDFTDEQNVRHRLFPITDKTEVNTIVELMRDKSCIIADGHHRYTTGLMYSKETDKPTAKYQMLAFCNTCHEGLIVLATHRLVANLEKFDIAELMTGLNTNFSVTEYKFGSDQSKAEAKQKMLAQMKAEHNKDKNAFGIYDGSGFFYVAVLKNTGAMDTVAPNMSRHWRSLDVAVLHKLVLEKLLGIGAEQLAGGANVEYLKDGDNIIDESVRRVDQNQKQAAFFMNPPKISQIRMVADAGERMPQKSTYFYPKVFTGLTINKL